MSGTSYRKYTEKARVGIKGEAYFESLIVDHSIPHRIARHNDLGVDFLCEWVCGDRPTGILFSVQVKSTTTDGVKPEFSRTSAWNGLAQYTLSGVKPIDKEVINYWKGLGLPAFLFVIVEDGSGDRSEHECYYKRYTPLLDGHPSPDDNIGTKLFYRVSEGTTFLAFAEKETETGGFARDLIIDYARLNYSKGHIVRLKPAELGFWPFPEKDQKDLPIVFNEMVGWHRERIEETWNLTERVLSRLPTE